MRQPVLGRVLRPPAEARVEDAMPNPLFEGLDLSWLPRVVFGRFGDDVLTGSARPELMLGLAGDDTIGGLGGNDALLGGLGDDILDGGAGNDILHGGLGRDTARFADATGSVIADLGLGTAITDLPAGPDEVDRLFSIENLVGSGFDDVLGGTGGANLLSGGDGDDRLLGRGGNDSIVGGDGVDTAVFAGALAAYQIDETDPDAVTVIGPDGTDVLTGVELLEFDDATVDLRPASPLINEFSLSTAGTDVEYVEFLADPNSDLSGLVLLQIEGDGAAQGTIDSVHALGITDAEGRYLLSVPANTFENGTVTLLLVGGFTGSVGQDIDTDNDGVIDVAPWTAVLDDVAVHDGTAGDGVYSSTVLDAAYDDAVYTSSFAPGGASRIPDGVDTDSAADWLRNDFDLAGIAGNTGTPELGEALNTPGTVNAPAEPDGGDPVALSIMQIQGAGHVSAHAGTLVATSGVVTAVDINGFYLQDPDGDGDIATSDGIFVFTGAAPAVAVGDAVDVTGTVSEFTPGGVATRNLSTTQIGGDPVVTVTGSGSIAPTLIGAGGRLPPTETIDDDDFASFDPSADGIDFFESLEGMLVTAQDLRAVSGSNSFGEIFAVVDGGAGATGLSDRGTLNLAPDDFNPERIQIDADSDILPGFAFPEVDTGDILGDVTGVMTYDFGNFEINPTVPFTPVAQGLEQEITPLFGSADQLMVASYNVLNLDPNDADGDTDLADLRFQTIAQQIVANLHSPDIIGLQEIQDNSGSVDDGTVSASQTLDLLVGAINAVLHSNDYAWIDNTFIADNASGGEPGGNIRTAIIYNTQRVDLVDGSVRTVGSQADGEAFDDGRLPLIADFVFNGETVTFVSNHLSSKSGSAPIMGTEQPFEGLQEDPTVNGSLDQRQAQAAEVKAFVDGLAAADPDANIVVVGDMNEFEFISPLADILAADTGADLTNLADLVDPDEIYSYVFQGNSQALDHILVSGNLAGTAAVDYVHLNAEFAETAARASDHDPLVALLTIPDEAAAV